MRSDGSKSKLNNAGFTLVELLLAITILGIIVGPMLYAFVYSTSMNTKSRRNLNATTVATDIAESIKANEIETAAGQLGNYASFSSEFDLINMTINDAGELDYDASSLTYSAAVSASAVRTVKTVTDPVTMATSSVTEYNFPDGATGKYYFYIDDAVPKFEGYDALICLDAANYRTTDNHNDLKMPVFSSIGGKSYVQKTADALMAKNTSKLYIKACDVNSNMSTFSDADLLNMLYRTIKIDIEQNGSDIKAVVSYIYTLKGYGITPVSYLDVDRVSMYDSSKTTEELDKLYLFYYPLYTSKAGDIHDEIIINNNTFPDDSTKSAIDALPVEVFLVRQEAAVSNLQASEMQYRTNVNVTEKATLSDAKTHLRTNIDYNMYHKYEPSVPEDIAQGTFKYNAVTNAATVKKALDITGLSDSEKSDRFYDMYITIYRSNAIESGTFDFSDDKKLYEIKGAVLQ